MLTAVQPVLKDGKPAAAPESYRPISLLCIVSKVLEALCHGQLLAFCMERGAIPDEQYSFLKGRSAEWLQLTTIQNWSRSLDCRHTAHTIFFDMAKAFDRVGPYDSSVKVGGYWLVKASNGVVQQLPYWSTDFNKS